jgi:hypothetical protein
MAPPSPEAAPAPGAPLARAPDPILLFPRRVEATCLDRLRDALDPATGLFARQLRNRRWERTRGSEDLTSTAICLVGLHRAGVDPRAVGLDPSRTLAALCDAWWGRSDPGALGLVVWANAVWDGAGVDGLLRALGTSLGRTGAATAALTTMETAWLVSGLLHEWRRARRPATRIALDAALAELLARRDPATHLFRHASDAASLKHRVRRFVANFADQIYAVQATAFAAASLARADALAASQACAARLASLQGDLGQWWWHYDPRDGRVVQTFPVYSVHQHAMAPMALLALAAAGGTDHRAAVERSYRWISWNETGEPLLDEEAGTIWRSVERDEGGVPRLARHARSVVGWKAPVPATAPRLRVNHETRPYEWGWCLYAGAIAAGAERREHAA